MEHAAGSMTAATREHYLYRLDSADRITFVSPEWLRFAETNDAPELTTDRVVGKPIWQFITGADTRKFYKAIYRNLRFRRAAITIPFRCDSPSAVRQMSMVLRLQDAGVIECDSMLLDAQPRAPITILFRWAVRSDEMIPICSLCRRLSVQGEWMDIRVAVDRWQHLNSTPVPRLGETVCPVCNCISE
jgi:hypothetical protein